MTKNSGITVFGTATVSAGSDRAELTLGVDVLRPEPAAAFETAARSVDAVMSALRAGGVEERAIRTVDLRLAPRTSYQNGAEVMLGYGCGQRMVAGVSALESLPDLLTAVAGSGVEGVRLEGISFSASDPAAALSRARELAVADGMRKAEQYAALVSRQVGVVNAVREIPGGGGHVPGLPKAERMMAASMPVAAGESDLTVTVELHVTLA